MKKIILFIAICFFILNCLNVTSAFWHKKEKPVLFLTNYDPRIIAGYDEKIEPQSVFGLNSRIYFTIYSKEGFKSDYLKYQIIKQDDKAHDGGFSRIRNRTVKITNKNSYTDYFVLSEKGKYFIQVFDITNLHQWLALQWFRVIDE